MGNFLRLKRMYHDASCGTDPYDQSTMDTDLASRWFTGLSHSVILRSEKPSTETNIVEKKADRAIQRFQDIENEKATVDIELDPADILSDEGISKNQPNTLLSIDMTTGFLIWKDAFGRDRRVRRDSNTGKRILGIGTSLSTAGVPKRELASYDDI